MSCTFHETLVVSVVSPHNNVGGISEHYGFQETLQFEVICL